VGERTAGCAEPVAQLVEEAEVDVDGLVGRAVEGGPTADDAPPQPVDVSPLKKFGVASA